MFLSRFSICNEKEYRKKHVFFKYVNWCFLIDIKGYKDKNINFQFVIFDAGERK